MAKTAVINIRTDTETKKAIENLYSAFGISVSDAVNIFFRKSIMQNGLPFDMQIPRYNTETSRLTENGYTPEFEANILLASEECYTAVANGTAKLYSNAAELFADLDAEEDDE